VFLIFGSSFEILLVIFCFSKKSQKLNKGKNGIDFSSNLDYAKKSLAKVMNHRIEKLSTLLDSNETQLNVDNATSVASENYSRSSTIKVEPLLMSKIKRSKVNSSIRKHKCETCKKRFPSPSQLNIHKRIHSKQKPFACDQCQKTFSQKQNFLKHKRVHTGEKPYPCDLCPMKFTQLSSLKSHKRIHTGEKPFSCDICPKKFTQSSDLTRHKRMHTGEKPYECDLCLKKFTRSSNLTAHKRNSHKIETVPM
jgi:general transcription factor IIIA